MPVRGQIRIVGGLFRRTVVPVTARDDLRPTPDRVRETVFNWLDQRIVGARCLDLFAGTGALGIEAASRGASAVLINEPNREANRSIEGLIQRLAASADGPTSDAAQTIELQALDAMALVTRLTQQQRQFDLIFLDPPFRSDLLQAIEPFISPLLAPQGDLYVESDQPITEYAGLQTIRNKKAGQVHYHLLNTTSNVESA